VQKAKDRLAALSGGAGGGQPEEDDGAALAKKLATLKIDLDFNDATLDDVLDFVRQFAKVAILVDPQVETTDRQVSFRVKDIAMDKALNLLAASAELEFVNRRGLLWLTSPQRAAFLRQAEPPGLPENATDEDRKVMSTAQAIRISLTFTGTPLKETMSFIREVSDVNIVLAEGADDIPVTLQVEDLPLTKVFDVIQVLADVTFTIRDGAWFVKVRR
jgi:hypothetical protein